MTDDRPELVRRLASRLQPADDPALTGAMQPAPEVRVGAVLALLYPGETDLVFPLTLRPETLRTHAGQVALPGGGIEDGESAWEAATRETEEELGIDRRLIRPVGHLEVLPTVAGRHVIIPFVGWMPEAPRLIPQPSEVAAVFEAPLERILDPAAIEDEVWEYRGREMIVTFYRIAGHAVWGATARILSDLAGRLEPSTPPRRPRPGSVTPT